MNARQKTVRTAGMSIIVKAGIKEGNLQSTGEMEGNGKKMVRVWNVE